MNCVNLPAQPALKIYTDFGQNNVSQGMYIKSAALGSYKFGKNLVETGFQADLKNSNYSGFSGYTIIASRNLTIKDMKFEIKGFYTWTTPSSILLETNWGTLLKMRHNH